MSEESKSPEGDYVMMGASGPTPGGSGKAPAGLDDPNLTQEDRDHRLAIALQQQENAAAYDAHKKKHDEHVQANKSRTTRSNTFTRLANIRDKDHGMLTVPPEYTTENAFVNQSGEYVAHSGKSDDEILKGATPEQVADYKLAKELQKVEQAGAGTAREMSKIVTEDATEEEAHEWRTYRSENYY